MARIFDVEDSARECAEIFAHEWIESWNRGDVERILSNCADDLETTSPCIVEAMGQVTGVLKGKVAARQYWQRMLSIEPPRIFHLVQVLVGATSVVICYRDAGRLRMGAEVLEFNARGEVQSVSTHYAPTNR